MLTFQEQVLKEALDRMPARSRVAFAASCAQRLGSVCHHFLTTSGQADRVELCDDALNYVWTHILTMPEKAMTGRMLADIMALIPDQDAPGWTSLTALAEDALSALAYCVSCSQSGVAQEAAWAARRVYEALDHLVTSNDTIASNEPEAEARVLIDPVIQAELVRQARDIADLSSAGDFLSPELLDRLRKRSAGQQAITITS